MPRLVAFALTFMLCWISGFASASETVFDSTSQQGSMSLGKGNDATFRSSTLSYLSLTCMNPGMLESHYLRTDSGIVGHFKKKNFGPDWIDFWGDFITTRLVEGGLPKIGQALSPLLPPIFEKALESAYGFRTYLVPGYTYRLSTQQAYTQYNYDYRTDRDVDIFADEPGGAFIVTLPQGDHLNVEGKLNYLGDRSDCFAVSPEYSGMLPLAVGRLDQEIDLSVTEHTPGLGHEVIYDQRLGEEVYTEIPVTYGSTYVFKVGNPARVNMTGIDYTIDIGGEPLVQTTPLPLATDSIVDGGPESVVERAMYAMLSGDIQTMKELACKTILDDAVEATEMFKSFIQNDGMTFFLEDMSYQILFEDQGKATIEAKGKLITKHNGNIDTDINLVEQMYVVQENGEWKVCDGFVEY